MRTSIEINENLLYEVKAFALESKKSLGTIIEDALLAMMAKKNRKANNEKISLKTFDGNGLIHGVDLDDNKSLLDIMDD